MIWTVNDEKILTLTYIGVHYSGAGKERGCKRPVAGAGNLCSLTCTIHRDLNGGRWTKRKRNNTGITAFFKKTLPLGGYRITILVVELVLHPKRLLVFRRLHLCGQAALKVLLDFVVILVQPLVHGRVDFLLGIFEVPLYHR